jgi:hypothetical protein
MRGRVCCLQLLMVLASAVNLGSESRGIRDHILLPQIRDSPFVASYYSQGYGEGHSETLNFVSRITLGTDHV